MNCNGFYEAEVIEEKTGEIVQKWESKNIVNYGFIGGLFKYLFGVGNTSGLIADPANVSRTPYTEMAEFNYLYLFQNSGTPTASEVNTISTYSPDSNGNSTKDLNSQSDGITYSSVVFDTVNKKITMTIQVTYGPSQGLITGQSSTTWYSMGIGSTPVGGTTPKLLSRVLMGAGITKTNSQTLRVRYNFSIIVT